jgi:uncharacterized membrane protein YdbT with pleckstrin-like domain
VSFPDGVLADGEQLVVSVHPHWSRLAAPAAVVPVVLVLTVFGVFIVPLWPGQDVIQYLIIACALGLLFYFSVLPWLRWVTTRYVVTTERLIVHEGVTDRSWRDIPLLRIGDASFYSSTIERILGAGTLVVSSVGGRGPLVLSSVPKVEDVHTLLYQLAEDAARRRHGG